MKRLLHHYFLPHEHNNYRSKLLHHSSLFLIAIFLFAAAISLNVVHRSHPEVLGVSYSINQQELLDDTNKVRQENGLGTLQLNQDLINAANAKAKDMFAKDYWAHFAPDGTSPWYFIKNSGYGYVYAGENLAKGFTDSQAIVTAWMNSPSHRENLLKPEYRDIGFAIQEGTLQGQDVVLVVQMFGATDVPLPIAQASPTPSAVVTLPVPSVTQTQFVTPAQLVVKTTETPIKPADRLVEVPRTNVSPAFLNASVASHPLIDISSPTRAIPIIIVLAVILALLFDFVIIERKKIPRLVGHNLDHIMILGMFLLLLLLEKFGSIL
jgi:hypothetical protein